MNGDEPDRVDGSLSQEDLVIVVIIATSLIGAVVLGLSLPGARPVLTASFLALGIAAVLYRFLGGIQQESLWYEGIRLGGSAGVFYLLVQFFLGQFTGPVVDPPETEWFAMDRSRGVPIGVTVITPNEELALGTPDPGLWADRRLSFLVDDDALRLAPPGAAFPLGYLPTQDLQDAGYFRGIGQVTGFYITTEKVHAGETIAPPTSPFALVVVAFDPNSGSATLRLLDPAGAILAERTLLNKEVQVVVTGAGVYLLGVSEADFWDPEEPAWARLFWARVEME